MAELVTAYSDNGVEIRRIDSIAFIGGKCQFWAWSPYTKCSYRCVYCSIEAQGKSKPALSIDQIPFMLDQFTEHKGNGSNPLVLGTLADAYPPEELEFEITRALLDELRSRPIPFSIVTHGCVIVRDIDLLLECPQLRDIVISIPHACNDNIKRYEPGAPTFEERVDAVDALHKASLPVGVNIAPWVPDVTDVERIANALPPSIEINVGALYYNEDNLDLVNNLCGRKVSSSQNVFSDQYPHQEHINALYLREYRRIGVGKYGNLKWLPPPDAKESFTTKLPDLAYISRPNLVDRTTTPRVYVVDTATLATHPEVVAEIHDSEIILLPDEVFKETIAGNRDSKRRNNLCRALDYLSRQSVSRAAFYAPEPLQTDSGIHAQAVAIAAQFADYRPAIISRDMHTVLAAQAQRFSSITPASFCGRSAPDS